MPADSGLRVSLSLVLVNSTFKLLRDRSASLTAAERRRDALCPARWPRRPMARRDQLHAGAPAGPGEP